MKRCLYSLFIFKLFIYVYTVIPLWNFESSTFDLLSENLNHSYTIYRGSACNTNNIELKKIISKNQNSISENNYIIINDKILETNWEDIESIYCISDIIYICPKGKNHMNKYNEINYNFNEIIPNGFSYDEDWELQCYQQSSFDLMFIGYLNKHNNFYSYKYKDNEWSTTTDFNQGLFDFKWTTNPINSNIYQMIGIVLDGNIKLQAIKYTINNQNDISKNTVGNFQLVECLSYSNAYFINYNDKYPFYFMTYNKDPPNFRSGYSLSDGISFEYINNFASSKINTESPLDFYYNFTIKQMNFIKNTKYVYYEIYNTDKNKIYHGLIDIILNKVLFNTDEKINSFKPYINNNELSNSMLIITDKSAYKICALYNDNNCVDTKHCSNILVDSTKPNFCGDTCPSYMLLPNKMCIINVMKIYFIPMIAIIVGFVKI